MSNMKKLVVGVLVLASVALITFSAEAQTLPKGIDAEAYEYIQKNYVGTSFPAISSGLIGSATKKVNTVTVYEESGAPMIKVVEVTIDKHSNQQGKMETSIVTITSTAPIKELNAYSKTVAIAWTGTIFIDCTNQKKCWTSVAEVKGAAPMRMTSDSNGFRMVSESYARELTKVFARLLGSGGANR